MKKLLLLFARNPRTSLFLVILLQLISIFFALVIGAIFPDYFVLFLLPGVLLTIIAWWFAPENFGSTNVCGVGLFKVKVMHGLAYLGLFLFVAGSFPTIEKEFISEVSTQSQISVSTDQLVMVEMQQKTKKDKGWLSRTRHKLNKGIVNAVNRVKRIVTTDPDDPYAKKRGWLLAGFIIGGVVVTLFLAYIACALACNGMGILALFVFFGGELLYGIIATQIIKKYWKKWRVKENEVNQLWK